MDRPITPQSSVNDVPLSTGLTSDEARRRLEITGFSRRLPTLFSSRLISRIPSISDSNLIQRPKFLPDEFTDAAVENIDLSAKAPP